MTAVVAMDGEAAAGKSATDLPALRGKDDWTGTIPRPPLRLPRSQRELFDLLALYDPQHSLAEFLSRLDCASLLPADVYRIVYGRVPADATQSFPRPNYDARQHLCDTLLSDQFRAGLLGSFLAAFPEIRRDVFIHVPKTAGTDLTLNLWPRRVSFPVSIDTRGSNAEALKYCAQIARHMPATDDIFVHGHMEFGKYIAVAGARLGDRFYSTVREPVDLLISQVSDLLGQFLRDREATQDYTRRWLGFMNLDRVPTDLTPRQMKDLWASALLNPKIAEPNNICRFLSHSGAVTYEAAMSNVVAYNVELTTTTRYSRWMAERWGIASATRHNASSRLLDTNEINRFLRPKLAEQMAEDEKFHAVVEWAFGSSDACAITGSQIAERAGPRLLSGFADELVERNRQGGQKTLWSVRGDRPSELYLEPLPERLTGCSVEVAAAAVFGQGGSARLVQGEGWSPPGKGGTWTESGRATLNLPPPRGDGLLVLQARLRPFTAPGVVTQQRVGIAFNGVAAGEVTVSDVTAIDCAIPPEALRGQTALEIAFTLPDAARSREAPDRAHDPRHLGCFFETVRLVRYGGTEAGEALSLIDPDGVVAYDRAPYLDVPGAAGVEEQGADTPLAGLTFGHNGDAEPHQGTGWSRGEHGFTWTNAADSEVRLPRPAEPGRYMLRAHIRPFTVTGRLTSQRVAVTINGVRIGEARVNGLAVLDCRASWDVLGLQDPMVVTFHMPDAARPTEIAGHANDGRLLGIAVQRLWLIGKLPPLAPPVPALQMLAAPSAPAAEPASEPQASAPEAADAPAPGRAASRRAAARPRAPAIPLDKLMLQFESLGENCEFGLVQRGNGAEPLGLFRFASAPLPQLMKALSARFAGIGAADSLTIEVSPNGREYMVFETRFNFRYHAWVGVNEKPPEEVLAREVKRLPFLANKLIEDLTEGTKLFVYRSVAPMTRYDAARLARAIRRYGPGTLLWVDLADATHPPGSVSRLSDGLLKGYIDRFAPPDNAHDLSLNCWNDMCAAAVAEMAKGAGA